MELSTSSASMELSTSSASMELSTSSVTTSLPTTNQFSEPRWIAGEITLLLITLVTIYIFAALMYYSWRFRNMARVSGSGHEMRERYLHYSCAAVIIMAIARCILHQIIVFIPQSEELHFCRVMMTTSRVVYNLAICLTYVHMWLRQRMFYTKEELKHLRTKVIEVIDWLELVLIVAASAALALIAFIPMGEDEPSMSRHNNICNVFDYSSKLFVKLYAGLAVSFQTALLLIYLYPILAQKLQQRRDKLNPSKSSSSPALKVYPALWSGIRRGFILTVVVIVTDILAAVLVWLLNRSYPDLFSSIIAINDVNLIINVVCAICTFRNWRKIVLGFPICRKFGWEKDSILRLRKPKAHEHETAQESKVDGDLDRGNNNEEEFIAEEKQILNGSIP